MPYSLPFPVIYLILAIIVSSVINIYAWRNPQTRGSRAFVAACLASIIWMAGDVTGRISDGFTGQWTGEIVRYLGVEILPVTMLVFIYQYCGKSINPRRIKWLLIVPAISWLVMVTNPWHNLFFSGLEVGGVNESMRLTYGIYFWAVQLPYAYSLLLTGFYTVFVEFTRASRHYRKPLMLLFISLCIPFIVNVIGVFRLLGETSYTAYSFPIFFTITAFAIFRYQFLGSNPIAYETVFQTIRDGVLILDQNDIIRDINPAAANGLAKEAVDVIGLHVREAFSAWPAATELYDQKPRKLGEIEVSLFGSTRYLSIDSTPMAGRPGIKEGRIITIRDITDRYQHQLSLEALAFHDPLTRVANRRKFQEEVDLAVEKTKESGETFTILYIDLNRFKTVNDTLGHEAGDELLKYVAARIASILRKPDILARVGGDEFALLLHKCDEHGVELVVRRMLENVQRPFTVGEHTLVAELSIGAAFYPADGKDLTELLRHADTAMYRAKQSGGGLAMIPPKIDLPTRVTM
jgi:diguanylate cyclase (GGDEF)-like protein/PAS domain S-box-containing protein